MSLENNELARCASVLPITGSESRVADLAKPEGKKGFVNNHPNSPWADQTVAQLLKLTNEGMSASVIAALMGVSRNAIIGKWHRLGISKPRKPSVVSPRGSYGKPRKDGSAVIIRFRPKTELFKERAAPVVPLHLDLLSLERHHCRFPYGDGRETPYTFCGHNKQEGSSYCPEHFALTWQPKQERRA